MYLRAMQPEDWPAVRDIYLAGIATGIATFQTGAPPYEQWDSSHLPDCRLVAQGESGALLGWAALSPTSARPVYRGVVEVSIYIAPESRGKGVGRALLTALGEQAEQQGYWTLVSSVFAENAASRGLHRACGFREVGVREKIARGADGQWHDTVLLERRSKSIL